MAYGIAKIRRLPRNFISLTSTYNKTEPANSCMFQTNYVECVWKISGFLSK